MNIRPSTPRTIWAGLLLMGSAVVVAGAGYWRSEAMTDDFQPIAVRLISLGAGCALSLAGIVCAVLGGRSPPRSTATKVAIVCAGVSSAAAASVATFLVRIYFAE